MNPLRHNAACCFHGRIAHALLVLAVCAGFSLSCQKSEKPAAKAPVMGSNIVAVVAGTEISAEALQAELRKQYRLPPEGGLTAEQKLAALESLVGQEALYAQAVARGFDQTQEMRARIKQLVVAEFKEREFKAASPNVTEQEIAAAYQSSGQRFVQPAAMRGAAIHLSIPATATAAKRAEARGRAEALLAEARLCADETSFARLVAQRSDEQTTRYRGGDLGWVDEGSASVEPLLAKALFALHAPGEFAPVVETPRGFYVAKLLEKRDAARKPLAEVRDTIRYQLGREKAAQAEREFKAAMKSGLSISINRELVESLALPSKKDEPPRLPGASTAQVR